MIRATIIISAFIIFSFFEAYGQFSVDAELRTRGEANQGYKYLPDSSSLFQAYVSQRTRLGMNYENEKIRTRIAIQDVRAWGGEDLYTSTIPYANQLGLDLFEAWVEIMLNGDSRLKIGRQVLSYDDQRLLGTRNWNQYAISYDALKYTYQKENWQVDAALSYNNLNSSVLGVTDGSNDYFTDRNRIRMLNFLHVNKKLGEHTSLSFNVITSGYKSPVYRNLLYVTSTNGFHLDHNAEKTSIKANAFYQFGRNILGQEVDAWMSTASASRDVGKFSLGAGIDIHSGNDASNTDEEYMKKDHTFDLLYGARYAYSGFMNQFGNLDASTRMGGLVDIYPFARYNFEKKHSILLRVHFFSLQGEVRDYMAGEDVYFDRKLGTEVDLRYSRPLMENMNIQAGFSWYGPSETYEVFRNVTPGESKTTWWGWLMLTYKPTFFSN